MGSIVQGIVTDVEGTTTPIGFVHETLFAYARRHLDAFLDAHEHEPEVAAVLAEVRRLAPGEEPRAVLFRWMDEDAKTTPLKTMQGLIWRDGYARREFRGALYPDVAPALRRWRASGLTLAVYSSGSEEAQRLLFAHTEAGDLTPLFAGFFDTRIGPKRDADSYRTIAARLGLDPAELLFLSDIPAELEAAGHAGWAVRHLLRREDGTLPSHFPTLCSFADLDLHNIRAG